MFSASATTADKLLLSKRLIQRLAIGRALLRSFFGTIVVDNQDSSNNMDKSNDSSALFVGKPDRFRGVTVSSKHEPCREGEDFKEKLDKSLEAWKAKVRKQFEIAQFL